MKTTETKSKPRKVYRAKIDYYPRGDAEREAWAAYLATNKTLNAELMNAQSRFDALDAIAHRLYRAFVRKHRRELEASK